MFDNPAQGIFIIFALFLGATLHEYAHAQVAAWLGDPTPREQGRVTINPIPHIDLFGSIILPLVLTLTGGIFLAYAKPVMVDPNRFRKKELGMLLCAVAGPAMNFLLALLFALALFVYALLAAFFLPAGSETPLLELVASLCVVCVLVNLALAFFNLIPLPPLDGSKVLAYLLPPAAREAYYRVAPFGMFIILAALFIRIGDQSLIGWYYHLTVFPAFNLLTTGGLG